jgi:hypothetical protein
MLELHQRQQSRSRLTEKDSDMTTSASYFLSYACVETLEVGIMEFDTYNEALTAYGLHEISGYSVVIRDIDMFGALASEIRKDKNYADRRTIA